MDTKEVRRRAKIGVLVNCIFAVIGNRVGYLVDEKEYQTS